MVFLKANEGERNKTKKVADEHPPGIWGMELKD